MALDVFPNGPHRLGLLVSGSLTEGLAARLDPGVPVEEVRLGKFVKIAGDLNDYFCLVTDVQLDAANSDVLRAPPGSSSEVDLFLREVLAGTITYGVVKLKPELMLPHASGDAVRSDDEAVPRPARTIPPHFSGVFDANAADFAAVFGAEGDTHFQIGQPIDMDVPVCINLARFVQRSNGVFGKSGTGKSFLTRLILCGIIRQSAAVNLIFDMHSEYGWSSQSEDGTEVKGLRQLFPGRALLYTLDPGSARARGVRPDGEVKIALGEITVEDVALLQDELKLHRTAMETAYICEDELGGGDWVRRLLEMDGNGVRAFSDRSGANLHSLNALRNKLHQIDRLPFVEKSLSTSPLDALIQALESGKNVVLEFGQQQGLLAYILVANVITRRLHQLWVSKTETFLRTKQEADRPQPLMITIEEAHKFLNAQVAHQTTFGTIARELRKFNVTLLVVDQRPSGIDDEVLSQIGTRITCQLNDERDIDAIFTGVSGGTHLRSVLATLDSREQALVLGHAVPMAVMVRTRKYDAAFYASLGGWGEDNVVALRARRYEEIFRDE